MTQQIPANPKTPRWVERELTHSRHVIANAKVVVTFSAALAATFVSAAMMQPNNASSMDEAALILMGFTLVITVCVVLLPPHHRRGELDEAAYHAAKRRALWAYWLMVVQVVVSVGSIIAMVIAVRHDLVPRIPVI
jgi:hypothetical protein